MGMSHLPDQATIMKNWQGDLDQPLVSICCITYNHEPYIEEALQGFLMQQTDFPFEILIHDDASTDNTAAIIRQYYANYPDIIKPIFQTDNQYSKGLRMNPVFNFPRAKGRYIALCEGDDFWINAYKLAKQVSEMTKYPDVGMSFHAAYEQVEENRIGLLGQAANTTSVVSLSQIILSGGGGCPTSSIMAKKNAWANLPEWFYKETPVGDFYLQILASQQGGALYILEAMCVYRRDSLNSWSVSMKTNPDKKINHLHRHYTCLKALNKRLNYQYADELHTIFRYYVMRILRDSNIPKKKRVALYCKYKGFLKLRQKAVWYIVYKHDSILNLLKGMKHYANYILQRTV